MPIIVLYKQNAAAKQSKIPVKRPDYSEQAIIRYIDTCTKQVGVDRIEIDTTMLQNYFFPTPHRTIFISHLSADTEFVHNLKIAIEHSCPNFSCFIDSDVWGNMYKVRDYLQGKYASLPDGYFHHEKANNICQHLSLVLSMALTKAIKDSPYFLYVPHGDESTVNTNSITTESPWVCHELLTSSLLREPPTLYKEATVIANMATSNLAFKYRADTQHLHAATLEDFITHLNRH